MTSRIRGLDESSDDDSKNSDISDTDKKSPGITSINTSNIKAYGRNSTSKNTNTTEDEKDEEVDDEHMHPNPKTEKIEDTNISQKYSNTSNTKKKKRNSNITDEESSNSNTDTSDISDNDTNTNTNKKSTTNEIITDSNTNSQQLRRSKRISINNSNKYITKRTSIQSSSNLTRKRNRLPPPSTIDWNDTLLKTMRALDIRLLLETRNEFQFVSKSTKQVMMQHLLKKCSVELDGNLMDYTIKQLKMECKLRGINEKAERKDIIIARLNGEIETPAIKKARLSLKLKSIKNPVYVLLYTPADTHMDDVKVSGDNDDRDEDEGNNNSGKQEMIVNDNKLEVDGGVVGDEDTCVLGVYRTEWRAYAKGCAQMLADLKLKNVRGWEKTKNVLKRQEFGNSKEKMDYLVDRVAEEFMENKEPYVVVKISSLLK